MNFDNESFIEQLKLRDEIKTNMDNLVELSREKLKLEGSINALKSIIDSNKKELENYKGIKNVIFNRSVTNSKKKSLNAAIDKYEKELTVLDHKINELNEEITKLEQVIPSQKSAYEMELSNGIVLEQDIITIKDSDDIANIQPDNNKEVIVHCTNFFPKDKTILCNYDGNKEYEKAITYKGVTKQTKAISHRHSCHFTRNNVVRSTGDGAGQWEQPKYIIIEPFDTHKEQFISDDPSDSWTYGSVKLSDKPILLVRTDEYDSIPKEELSNYTVLKYDGEYDKCVLNMLQLLGVVPKHTDANYAGHHYSLEMATEVSLDARNNAINYIKDNTWNGKSDISLSEEELFALYEISQTIQNHSYNAIDYVTSSMSYDEIEEVTGISQDFVKFMIGFGIVNNNGSYSFKNDNQVYKEMSDLEVNINDKSIEKTDKIKHFVSSYDFEEMKKTFDKYKSFQEQQHEVQSNSDINSMSCKDIFKFSNIDFAKVVFDKLKKMCTVGTSISLTENGCLLNTTVMDSEYDYEQIASMKLDLERIDSWSTTVIKQYINAHNIAELFVETSEFMSLLETAKLDKDNQVFETQINKTL